MCIRDSLHPEDNCPHPSGVVFTIFEDPDPNASFTSTGEIKEIDVCASEEEVTIYFDRIENFPEPSISSDVPGLDIDRDDNSAVISFPPDAETYQIMLQYNIAGCDTPLDVITLHVREEMQVQLQCGPQKPDSLILFWEVLPDVTSYEVFLDGVSQGIVDDTTTIIDGLDVGVDFDVTVEPLGIGCLNAGTVTCATGGCIEADVDLSNLNDPFCYDPTIGPINLDVVFIPTASGLPGSYEWQTPLIDADNNFIPDPGQENYTFDIIYTEGSCTTLVQAASFVVFTAPEAALSFEGDVDTICTPEIAFTAAFSGPDPLAAIEYDPIWPAGVNPTGTGPGEWLLRFDGPGFYDIGVITTYNGCPGPAITRGIEVLEPIAAPNVTCSGIIGGISLSWEPQNGVTSYEVFVNGESVATTSANAYEIPFLDEGQSHDWQVVAFSNTGACINAVASGSCTSSECPTLDVTVTDVDTCFNQTLPPFDIPVVAVDSDMIDEPGSGSWSGQLINGDGQVDASLTNFGDVFTLEYTYVQGNCSTTVTAEVNLSEPPLITGINTQGPVCEEDSLGTVMVTAVGGVPGYTYAINGGPFQMEPDFTDIPVGVVEVEVMDAAGCVSSDISEVMDEAVIPDLEIEGMEVIAEANDAVFTLDTDIASMNIKNIRWYLDGQLVLEGANADSLLLEEVAAGGTLDVELVFLDDCVQMATKSFDISQIQSVYIPNMMDLSGTARAPDNAWTCLLYTSPSPRDATLSRMPSSA